MFIDLTGSSITCMFHMQKEYVCNMQKAHCKDEVQRLYLINGIADHL